ncbi:MAG: hypothetical protein ABI763_08735 [Bacteroidota bacterium]
MIPKQVYRILLLLLLTNTFTNFYSIAQSYTGWNDLVGGTTPGTQGALSYYWDDGTTFSPIYVPGSAQPGDVLTNNNGSFDFNALRLSGTGHFLLPLIIPPGVALTGNYNLLSTPNGTKFYSKNIRSQHFIVSPYNIEQMFLFAMAPTAMTNGTFAFPTTMSGLRIEGPALNWTDFNAGHNSTIANQEYVAEYTGGVLLDRPGTLLPAGTCVNGTSVCYGYGYIITNCEIYGFSLANIWIDRKVDNVTISDTYLHHTKGRGVYGIGYNIWMDADAGPGYILNGTNITLHNVIFDEGKEALDGSTTFYNIDFFNNTLTQFSGGINKHNKYGAHMHPGISNASADCRFYNDPSSLCETVNVPFQIHDDSPGDVLLHNSIFHSSGGSVNYPYFYGPVKKDYTSNIPAMNNPTVLSSLNVNYGTLLPNTNLNNGGWYIPFTNGFTFPFFNDIDNANPKTGCYISSNGFLKFDNANGITSTYSDPPHANIPDPSDPNGFIALCWTDLDPSNSPSGIISYEATANTFVLKYENINPYNGSGSLTGYIVLHSTGVIEILIGNQDLDNSGSYYPCLSGVEDSYGQGGQACENAWKYSSGSWVPNPWRINAANEQVDFYYDLPQKYKVWVTDNTFSVVEDSRNKTDLPTDPCGITGTGINLNYGFTSVADNYIENCAFDDDVADQTIKYSPNFFSYKIGSIVTGNSPQPPEVYLDLFDGGGQLPQTFNKSVSPNHIYTQYSTSGNFDITLSPGQGSQDLTYLIKPNSSNPVLNPPASNASSLTTSSNNYFYSEEQVINTGNIASISYNVTNDAGLHGIDVLAVANNDGANWKKYNASAWQHISVIVPSPEKHLIFNIKDSYQEFHNFEVQGCTLNCTVQPTGMMKQVELNGTMIWQEDVAFGGDGWERIDINLAGNIPPLYTTSILSLIHTDGKKNTITFSIASSNPSTVLTDNVKGLLVWIDDAYIKKANSPDNLISDGGIELCKKSGLEDFSEPGLSIWYMQNKTVVLNCTSIGIAPQQGNNSSSLVYPDGSPLLIGTCVGGSGPQSMASTNYWKTSDRKSGEKSLLLKLPYIIDCADYGNLCFPVSVTPTNTDDLISAAFDFDFREFFACNDYPNVLNFPNPVTGPSYTYNTSPTITSTYHLTSDWVIGDGVSPTVVTIEDCAIAIDPGKTITVTANSVLNIIGTTVTTASNLFACGDMWKGIVVNAGGTINTSAVSPSHSHIADAELAIDNQQGKLNLTRLDFDRNYSGILYNPGSYTSAGGNLLTKCKFSCDDSVITKPLYANQVPPYHVMIDQVSNVTIGSTSAGANIFTDATNAIEIKNGGWFQVLNGEFDNNIIDIYSHDGNYSGSSIYQSKFTYSALPGFEKQIPFYHIILENVSDVNIGYPGLNYINNFEQKGYGIYSINSSFHAFNNLFVSIGYLEKEQPGIFIQQGGGIFAFNDDASLNTVVIDDQSSGYPNKFIHCNTGIYATGISNLTIEKNNKDINDGGFESCAKAINIYKAPANSVISVIANDAIDFIYGLQIFDMGKYSQFHVNGNWFNCDDTHIPLAFDATTAGYKAISIQNPLSVEVVGTAFDNIISNSEKGIHLRNIANRHAGQILIGFSSTLGYSNQVHYLNAQAPGANKHYFGYWFENCDNLEVENNIALSNTTPQGPGIDKHFRGFSVDNTTNSNFCSNKAEQLGSGVWVYNKCGGTYFMGFNTTGNWHNIHMANADLPWHDVSGNDLHDTWNSAGSSYDFAGSLLGGLIVKWYSNSSPTKEPGLGLINLNIFSPTGSISGCQTAQSPADDKRKENFGSAITDSTDYGEDFPEENEYQDKEAFYNAALKDSTILTLGLPDDVVFQNAFDSLSQTNLATISDVKQLLDLNNVSSALVVNNTIAPVNASEANSKEAHQLFAAYRMNYSLSSTQKVQALSIGVQTALEGGLDVYTMRALLNEDVFDDIDISVNLRRASNQHSATEQQIVNYDQLHPNPASHIVNFTSRTDFGLDDRIAVYNFLHQKIIEYKLPLNNKSFVLDIESIVGGIYSVIHFSGNESVSKSKLVIIK